MKVHPALSYTLYRFSLIVAVACVLFLVGFRSWALVLGAFVISLPLSWFVLRKQRQQLAVRIAEHQERRQVEREELRKALDAEPDTDVKPAAEAAVDPPTESPTEDPADQVADPLDDAAEKGVSKESPSEPEKSSPVDK